MRNPFPPQRVRRLWGLALLALATTCSLDVPAPDAADSGVLFFGNSLTYWNRMPEMIDALYRAALSRPFAYRDVSQAGASLADHWHLGNAEAVIANGEWTWVILQQGPSALQASREELIAYTRRFAAAADTHGAKVALYATWPVRSRPQDFPRAIESYRLAAADVGGLLLPVSAAWLAAWRRDSTIALYDDDGLHPSPTGSYLAALVIFQGLTRQPALGAPSELRRENGEVLVTLSSRVARTLQEAAAEARTLADSTP